MIKKMFLLILILCFCAPIFAKTIVVSNLSTKKTQFFISRITKMYDAGFDVKKDGSCVKPFLTDNYILHSNSQNQNLTQLIAHLNYLHRHYIKINKSPFELIQITNDFMTLKYKVYLTDHNNNTSGFNFIAIYHFDGDKIDKTWEVASPISAKNIR